MAIEKSTRCFFWTCKLLVFSSCGSKSFYLIAKRYSIFPSSLYFYISLQEKLAGMDASSTIMEARRRLEEQERTNDPAARRPRNPVIVRALCPVCLQADLIFPVETNCGHKFCTRCFLQYWRADRRFPGACSCPMCRRSINLVIPDRRNVKCTEYAYLLAQVADFNNKMTKEPRTVSTCVYNVITLLYSLQRLYSSGTPLLKDTSGTSL